MAQNNKLVIEPAITLETLMDKGQELPSLPEIYLRVSEQLEDESVSAQQIGATVQNDPAITSRILKMVNSAYFGLPNEVSSVSKAVSLLGRDLLKQILIGTLMRGVFGPQENPAFSMQAFWMHSIKTAIIARQLARDTGAVEEPETLFTAGLLHDIGKLMMIDKIPELVLAAEEYMIRKRTTILEAELVEIGVTHIEIGEQLLQHWGLPQILIDCVREHHSSENENPAIHIVYLANKLSKYVPPLDDAEARDILEDIDNWEHSGASVDQIASACQYADEMVFEVMESLGMVSLDICEEG